MANDPGRPKKLSDPQFFRIKIERAQLDELRELCEERMITMNAFIRRAIAEFMKKVKG
jgi:hypothetical protein